MVQPQAAAQSLAEISRRIVVNPLFALLKHNIAFQSKIFVADFQILHPVSFQKHCQLQPADVQSLMIGRHVRTGKSVALGAVSFHNFIKTVAFDFSGAAKHQMLKQMSLTAFSQRFVNASGLIPNHMLNYRSTVIRYNNHPQTVVQIKLFGISKRKHRQQEQYVN